MKDHHIFIITGVIIGIVGILDGWPIWAIFLASLLDGVMEGVVIGYMQGRESR